MNPTIIEFIPMRQPFINRTILLSVRAGTPTDNERIITDEKYKVDDRVFIRG